MDKFMNAETPHQLANIRNEVATQIEGTLKYLLNDVQVKLCGWRPCRNQKWQDTDTKCMFSFLPDHKFEEDPQNSTFMTESKRDMLKPGAREEPIKCEKCV